MVLRGRHDAFSEHPRHPGIFDCPRFAEPLRERILRRAQELAAAAGETIVHGAKAQVRKAAIVAAVVAGRGDHPGLVRVLSAMEACARDRPWHEKASGRPPAKAGITMSTSLIPNRLAPCPRADLLSAPAAGLRQ